MYACNNPIDHFWRDWPDSRLDLVWRGRDLPGRLSDPRLPHGAARRAGAHLEWDKVVKGRTCVQAEQKYVECIIVCLIFIVCLSLKIIVWLYLKVIMWLYRKVLSVPSLEFIACNISQGNYLCLSIEFVVCIISQGHYLSRLSRCLSSVLSLKIIICLYIEFIACLISQGHYMSVSQGYCLAVFQGHYMTASQGHYLTPPPRVYCLYYISICLLTRLLVIGPFVPPWYWN